MKPNIIISSRDPPFWFFSPPLKILCAPHPDNTEKTKTAAVIANKTPMLGCQESKSVDIYILNILYKMSKC